METATHCRASANVCSTAFVQRATSANFACLASAFALLLLSLPLMGQAVLPVDNNPPARHSLTAIVAWNGQEQILLTSSTFSSDIPSAIHMTVVPTNPTPLQVATSELEGIGKLITTYFIDKGAGRMPVESYQKAAIFPTATVMRELPEAANLTTERNLINWLNASNRAAGFPESKLPSDLRRGINRAIGARGEWTLASRVPSVPAGGTTAWAGGKFSTNQPYFPLRLLGGQPEIKAKIFIITPSYASYTADAVPYITDLTESLTVPQKDLAAASPYLGSHFSGQGRIVIRTIEVSNLPRSFNFGLFVE